MKKTIICILLYLTSLTAQCQTFASAFEPWDNTSANFSGLPLGSGWSYWTNGANYFSGNQASLLQDYLNIYKATKDIHYLEKFAIQATREMERRDGIELGKMDSHLLQKVEELTLYIIQQQKQTEQQEEKIKELQEKVDALSKEHK